MYEQELLTVKVVAVQGVLLSASRLLGKKNRQKDGISIRKESLIR
jgi:hypothetical protein